MTACLLHNRDAGTLTPMMPGPAESRAVKDDARWFAKNKRRVLRLRPPAGLGEIRGLGCEDAKASGYPALVLVRQIRSGIRHRRIIYTSLPTPEDVLAAFERLVDSAAAQGYVGELMPGDLARAMGAVPRERNH
jgi:hypothetical protein